IQAEDGIRSRNVTGVQTCALPISTKIVAVDLSAVRLEKALAMGATDVVNPSEVDDAVATVREILGGGADVSFEVAGVQPTFEQEIGRASCRERWEGRVRVKCQ